MKVVRSISISEEIDKELRERYSEANVSILCEQALGEYVSMRERAAASRSANTHLSVRTVIEMEDDTIVVNVYPDGDQVCALIGENLQDGDAGFGDDVPGALRDLADALSGAGAI